MNTVFPSIISPLGGGQPQTDVASIEILGTVSGLPGSTLQLTAVCKDQNGQVLTGKTVSWASLNPAVATVDNSGLVLLVYPGQTAIVARVDRADDFQIPGSSTLLTVNDPATVAPNTDDVLMFDATKQRFIPRPVPPTTYPALTGELGVVHLEFQYGNVKRYGAKGDGSGINDTAAFAAAAAALALVPGARMYIPAGNYYIDGITITTDGVAIDTDGIGTKLNARANNQTLIKIAASNCIVGDFTLDSVGWSGVVGLALVPADETSNTTYSNQNFNRIGRIVVNGAAEAVRMRCGPGTVIGDSGCWYNTILSLHAVHCVRGIWLQSPVSNGGTAGATSGSQVNRNDFLSVRVGQGTNTGIQIDSGATNRFFSFSCEGINTGTTPNAIPTGIYINETCPVTGGVNDTNQFFGYIPEANTLDIFNDCPTTEFYGNGALSTKCAGAFPYGGINLSANPSYMPLILPGMEYGEGISGVSSGAVRFKKPVTVDKNVTALWASRYSGTTGILANGSVFSIDLPAPRVPMILTIYHNANVYTYRMYVVVGDGVSALQLTPLLDTSGGGIVATPNGPTQLHVTNNTGFAVQHSWGALAMNEAI